MERCQATSSTRSRDACLPDCGSECQLRQPELPLSRPATALPLGSDRRPVGGAATRSAGSDGRPGPLFGPADGPRPARDGRCGRVRDPLRDRVAGAAGRLPTAPSGVRLLRTLERAGPAAAAGGRAAGPDPHRPRPLPTANRGIDRLPERQGRRHRRQRLTRLRRRKEDQRPKAAHRRGHPSGCCWWCSSPRPASRTATVPTRCWPCCGSGSPPSL